MSGAWADTSPEIDLLAAAWVDASGELRDVPKSKSADTGKYGYKYADLADALDIARPVLARHGLAVTQTAESDGRDAIIWTTVLHRSGQYVTANPMRLPVGQTAQATGSAVTYARRYALLALLGLATDDDDGAAAAPRAAEPTRRSSPPRRQGVSDEPRTTAESEIRGILASLPREIAADVKSRFEIVFGGRLSALDPTEHPAALDWIRATVDDETRIPLDGES